MSIDEVVNMAEGNYIKRFQDQIAGLNKVDTAARDQRVSIEKELDADPYFDHLYSEQAYDHLTFLELRRTNHLLMAMIQMLSQHYGGPEIDLSQVFPHKVSNENNKQVEVLPEPSYAIPEDEDAGPVLEADSPELQSMTPAEQASARRSKPARRR